MARLISLLTSVLLLIICGCESVSTVRLGQEALAGADTCKSQDSEECSSPSVRRFDTLNDVVGLPYALPKTYFEVEVKAIGTAKPKAEDNPNKCLNYSFQSSITPVHFADPDARFMLRMGELGPFSNRQMSLQVNQQGLLQTTMKRTSEGAVQAALGALTGPGRTALSAAEDASAEKSAPEDAARKDSWNENILRFFKDKPADNAIEADNLGDDSVEFSKSESFTLPTTGEVRKFYCEPYSSKHACNQTFEFKTKPKCDDYSVTLTLGRVDAQDALDTPSLPEDFKGRGRILYRIYRQSKFQMAMQVTDLIKQGDTRKPSSATPREYRADQYLTYADLSQNFALQVTDGLISGTGLQAAFADGQLVGISMARPSPIVAVVTAPFEVIGAITAIPAILSGS